MDRLNMSITNLFKEHPSRSQPAQLIGELFKRLHMEGNSEEIVEMADPRCSDYQTLLGPAFSYSEKGYNARLAIWVSWQITKSDTALSSPLICFYQAIDDVMLALDHKDVVGKPSDEANVEYLVCRTIGSSTVRGKGKLSVPREFLDSFKSVVVEAPVSRFCALLEDSWRAELQLHNVAGLGELTVAWRESWLGHWSYL
jgi:hypothetical protein